MFVWVPATRAARGRGGRGDRYNSQPEPHAYGCGAGAGRSTTRKLGFHSPIRQSVRIGRAAATALQRGVRGLWDAILSDACLLVSYTASRPQISAGATSQSGALEPQFLVSGAARALSRHALQLTHDAARHTRWQLDSSQETQETQSRRGATSRAAEACPGYCKPAGASQRTYSASIDHHGH